jgi:MraZ protein
MGAEMPLLVGRYVNKIDKKGRVSVPKPFRDSFKGQGFKGIYAYPLFKYPAIEACGEDFMMRLGESLDDLDVFSDEQDDLAAAILERAHALPFDSEGRVVVPDELLAHGGISGEVVFVGRGSRMQIWEPKAYDANSAKAFERARARGATLRLRPARPQDEGS